MEHKEMYEDLWAEERRTIPLTKKIRQRSIEMSYNWEDYLKGSITYFFYLFKYVADVFYNNHKTHLDLRYFFEEARSSRISSPSSRLPFEYRPF